MMQTILIAVLTAAQAYLLGSVDTGILISKFVYHDDVRNHGSGAAGMTHLLDKSEGSRVSHVVFPCPGPQGKGVLVAGGAILAIQPVLLPFLALIFLACLLPTGMVSLGSVTMAAAYPLLTLGYCLMRGYAVQDLLICLVGSVIMAAMVIYMHRSNIQRIRDGKEYRFGRHGKQ